MIHIYLNFCFCWLVDISNGPDEIVNVVKSAKHLEFRIGSLNVLPCWCSHFAKNISVAKTDLPELLCLSLISVYFWNVSEAIFKSVKLTDWPIRELRFVMDQFSSHPIFMISNCYQNLQPSECSDRTHCFVNCLERFGFQDVVETNVR